MLVSERKYQPIRAGRLLASHLCEAVAAINWSVFLRLEGNSSDTAAASASSLVEGSAALACVLLSVAASLASLGLICEALLCVELLLTSGEYEVSAAVLAL